MTFSPINTSKSFLQSIRDLTGKVYVDFIIRKRLISQGSNVSFDFELTRHRVLGFINLLKIPGSLFKYKYASKSSKATLYGSVYACMILGMLDEIKKLTDKEKIIWRNYFDSFQNKEDGLFYDPVVMNEIYSDADWWGARHISLHMISAYSHLGFKPKYKFKFLKPYHKEGGISEWLDCHDWKSVLIGRDDLDNKIMNIGCLLQYQRDTWGDELSAKALKELKSYLKRIINPKTGMWGGFDADNPEERSRMVQFAYHLFPIFFYDGDYDFDCERIVHNVLRTKNKLGGFGVKFNSSACEDIDSIDLLIRLEKYCSPKTQAEINNVITQAFKWVMQNQVDDGGFVFRLEEPFIYGNSETSSYKNEGAMMPTWFRTLSLAYMVSYLKYPSSFKLVSCPGYEFL